MTSRYAHIFDETLKIEFEKFQERLVTKEGEFVNFEKKELTIQIFNGLKRILMHRYCQMDTVVYL